MSVDVGDVKFYQAASMPVDETSPVGGACSAVEITGATVGEIFPSLVANAAGGADKTKYSKFFVKNTHGTDSGFTFKAYIRNALDNVSAAGTVTAVSSHSSDGNTKKLYITGEDGSGTPQSEEIVLNGTSTVTGVKNFGKIYKVEIRLVSSGAKTTAAGDITITRGSALGILPAGYSHAHAEFNIGLPATLNDTVTTTNVNTAPAGISFSRPNSSGEALSFASSGTLGPGDAQGVWVQYTLADGALPLLDLTDVIVVDWSTS